MLAISYGTRPEYIKLEPIWNKLKEENIPFKLIFTGQHEDFVHHLAQTHAEICVGSNRLDSIVQSLLGRDRFFDDVSHLMVQGDTTSTFAMALGAFHRQIPVIHVEAGLRTWDHLSPYPEEFNRTSISKISSFHFCPTELNMSNLIAEKIKGKKYVVGNTIFDTIQVPEKIEYGNVVLITLHRRENIPWMKQWFEEIVKLSESRPDLVFIFPKHWNEEVSKCYYIFKNSNVKLINPIPREELIKTINSCKFVISDSGGICEEASFLRKKVIECRNKTERTEGMGIFSFLCFAPDKLKHFFEYVNKDYKLKTDLKCPYGDGHASEKIVEILKKEIL